MNEIELQAHKGVASECPENTMSAFRCAAVQGYDVIELDLEYTLDEKIVVIHDKLINRTARLDGGAEIGKSISINEITFNEAQSYDFGVWLSNKYQGEKIPLFGDVLAFAKDFGIRLKIDNKIQNFPKKILDILFCLLKDYEDCVSITSKSVEFVKVCLASLPNAAIDYDGEVSEEILKELSLLIPRERLTVWLPYECENTRWVKIPFADEASAALVKRYAKLGIWLLSDYESFEAAAERLMPDIVETDGTIKPVRRKNERFDMHTHSRNSHDSECSVADMAAKECEKGISGFAVTDHCDIEYCETVDINGNCQASVAEAKRENKKTDIEVLHGVEIGEIFWNSDFSENILKGYDFDAVIGSVHAVRFDGLEIPYSQIDFSELGTEITRKYMKQYFSDMIYMLENCELDILAHLTCPLRYINGKYGLGLCCEEFSDEITKILSLVIKHKIALEINTSCVFEGSGYCELLPEAEIVKKYKEMGGYLVTTGSDAHIAENAANSFDMAYALLKELGFKNVFYYKNRCAIQCSIV